MTNITTLDSALRQTLKQARVIAVVGHSDKPYRTSYQIAQYLRGAGYIVYPVNPTVDEIDGHRSYPTLRDVPGRIDIVNVFRRSEYLPEIVSKAIDVGALMVWAQLGVINPAAETLAEDAGINLVMDRCIKVEHLRLGI